MLALCGPRALDRCRRSEGGPKECQGSGVSPKKHKEWRRRGCGCLILGFVALASSVAIHLLNIGLTLRHPALSKEREIPLGDYIVIGLWKSFAFGVAFEPMEHVDTLESRELVVLDLDMRPVTPVSRIALDASPMQALVHRHTLYVFTFGPSKAVLGSYPPDGPPPMMLAWDIRDIRAPLLRGQLEAPSNLSSWCAHEDLLYVSMDMASGVASVRDPDHLMWSAGPWADDPWSDGETKTHLVPARSDLKIWRGHLIWGSGLANLSTGKAKAFDYGGHFVAGAGRYIYTVHAHGGITTLDMAQPARPRRVHTIHRPWMEFLIPDDLTFGGLAVKGRFGYLARAGHGAAVVDLSNPARPSIMAARAVFSKLVFVSEEYVCYTQPPFMGGSALPGYGGFKCGSSVYLLWEGSR